MVLKVYPFDTGMVLRIAEIFSRNSYHSGIHAIIYCIHKYKSAAECQFYMSIWHKMLKYITGYRNKGWSVRLRWFHGYSMMQIEFVLDLSSEIPVFLCKNGTFNHRSNPISLTVLVTESLPVAVDTGFFSV